MKIMNKIRHYINNKPKELTDYIENISDEKANYYQEKFERDIPILIKVYIFVIVLLSIAIIKNFNFNSSALYLVITNKYFVLISMIYQYIFFIGYWLLYLTKSPYTNSKNISEEASGKIKKLKIKYAIFFCLFLFLANIHKF